MTRRRNPVNRTSRHTANNLPGQPVRIVDEATRRAWSLLWPDMADAQPAQPDLTLDNPKPPENRS
jgi:hypothetical protein